MAPAKLITAPTAAVIAAIARRTVACDNHGQIEAVTPREGSVTDSSYYMRVILYDVTFADGLRRTYWMRGGVPTEAR